jgi:hypothetical protein
MQMSQELVGWRISGMADVERNFGLESTIIEGD